MANFHMPILSAPKMLSKNLTDDRPENCQPSIKWKLIISEKKSTFHFSDMIYLLSMQAACDPNQGIYRAGYIYLYTKVPSYHGKLASVTSGLSLICWKLCNLQICIIYH